MIFKNSNQTSAEWDNGFGEKSMYAFNLFTCSIAMITESINVFRGVRRGVAGVAAALPPVFRDFHPFFLKFHPKNGQNQIILNVLPPSFWAAPSPQF